MAFLTQTEFEVEVSESVKLPARILNLQGAIKEEYQDGLNPKFQIQGEDYGLFTVDDLSLIHI